MILNARLLSYARFVKIVVVVFVAVSIELLSGTAWAQPPVVHGVQGVINAVRPGVRSGRIDPLSVSPSVDGAVGITRPLTNGWFSDPFAQYPVGTKEVTWISREGIAVSGLLFFPAALPQGGRKFSAIIYSHGLGASAEDFSYLGYTWAGRGIVVLCLRHPDSDESIWRGKIRPMNELKEAYQRCWSARDRALALRSGIDFLFLSRREPAPWGQYLDFSKIGVAGNDLGALGALLIAGQIPPDNGPSLKDSRVALALALSPPVFCEKEQAPFVYESIRVPTMIVTGTKDDGIVGVTKAPQRRIPYDGVQNVDRYLVVLLGGDHRVYGGRKMGAKQANDRSYQETIARETADFITAYLSNDRIMLGQMRSFGKTCPLSNAHIEHQIGGQYAPIGSPLY
ncbi:MAG: hypothetical protein IKX88_13560 [Thermoguttaceae bacterium]|nr:hypothetical protein [Thermoguttaceae bacterium]